MINILICIAFPFMLSDTAEDDASTNLQSYDRRNETNLFLVNRYISLNIAPAVVLQDKVYFMCIYGACIFNGITLGRTALATGSVLVRKSVYLP